MASATCRQHRPAARRGRTAVEGRRRPHRPPRRPSNVNVAVGYGGRQEIVDAVRDLLTDHVAAGETGEQLVEAVTVEAIDRNLYTKGQPDPDLVIRTSGEQRLSGFLLWQSAYPDLVHRCVLARVPPRRLPACPARLRRAESLIRTLTRICWSGGARLALCSTTLTSARPRLNSATSSSSASSCWVRCRPRSAGDPSPDLIVQAYVFADDGFAVRVHQRPGRWYRCRRVAARHGAGSHRTPRLAGHTRRQGPGERRHALRGRAADRRARRRVDRRALDSP